MDLLRHQVMRFQYPSPYSQSQQVKIDPKFKVRPFVLLLRLLLDPDLERKLTHDDVALIVIFHGTGDSAADAVRVATLIKEFRSSGIDEAQFLADHCKESDTFAKARARFKDIANTVFNWLEVTGVVEREKGAVFVSEGGAATAQALLDQYSSLPLLRNAEETERFQRSYGLPPWKQKDTRNLAATPSLSRAEFVFRQVNTVITRWAQSELLIEGATPEIVARLVTETQFEHQEVETAAKQILGTDRTLETYLYNYQALVYSQKRDAPRVFEQATAEILRQVFGLEAVCVGQSGREPDVVVTQPNEWRGIIDTKAYSGEYTLPSSHDRAMREYVERYSATPGETLRFWAFIAGAISRGAGAKATSLSSQTGIPGVVVGMLAWLQLIRLGQEKRVDGEQLADYLSKGGELTVADLSQ
ncbi:MAG: hypothetical protein C0444_01535 [Microbacterium sp.]|nr:hypothetical protein [Microbacterium sp.]MBA4345878.1 hypothetical protein [Microbacterium sp.]